ncbi:hypothetical protein ID866_3259 [Astraeus odoratus]|nr:hypothetical protein ID866_3259 [Astraeus odoratus]
MGGSESIRACGDGDFPGVGRCVRENDSSVGDMFGERIGDAAVGLGVSLLLPVADRSLAPVREHGILCLANHELSFSYVQNSLPGRARMRSSRTILSGLLGYADPDWT